MLHDEKRIYIPRVYNNHNLYVPQTERVIKRNAHIHQVGYFNRTQLSTDRLGRKKCQKFLTDRKPQDMSKCAIVQNNFSDNAKNLESALIK